MSNRRDYLKKVSAGEADISLKGVTSGMSDRSTSPLIGITDGAAPYKTLTLPANRELHT